MSNVCVAYGTALSRAASSIISAVSRNPSTIRNDNPARAPRPCSGVPCVAGLGLFLLTFATIAASGLSNEASAQVFDCTGGPNIPTSNTKIEFDGAGGCTIVDSLGQPPEGGFAAQFIPTGTGIVQGAQFVTGANAPLSVVGFSFCNLQNNSFGALCRLKGNSAPALVNGPVPIILEWIDTGLNPAVTYRMEAQVTASNVGTNLVSFTIGSARVCVGSGPAACTPPTGAPTAGITPQDRATITNALFNSLNTVGGGIFETDGTSIFGNGAQAGNGISFMPTALSLGSEQQSDDPFYRQFGGVPVGGRHRPDDVTTNAGFNFRLDLNAVRAQARSRTAGLSPAKQQSLADSSVTDINLPGRAGQPQSYSSWKTSMKDKPAVHEPRFNAWASGRHVDFDDDQQNADRSGHIWRVTSGMSYRVGERTKLGAFGRVRKGEVDSTAMQSSLDSSFYGGGLFGIFQNSGGARLMLSGLYETSDSDITIQGVTGSFDADQWTVEAIVDKRFTTGRSWIEPSAKVFYTEADRDGYVDSAGNQIAGSTLALGRFTAGPKIGTTIAGGGKRIAEIRPYAKFAGVWDFESEGDFALSTGAVFSTSDNGLNAGGGVEVEFVRGTTLTLAGDWFGTNSELEGWSVSGGIGTSLAALGLGSLAPTGLFSLDLAASAEDQSAKAKVVIALN